MANGDAAVAIGMDIVPGTMDLRQGYDEINKTRDYVAEHETSGTHDASAINSGVLAAARIPDLDAAKITSGELDTARIPDIPQSKVTGAWTKTVSAGAAGITGGNFVAAGDVDAAGSMHIGGSLFSVAGRSTPVTSSYAAAYFNGGDNRLGVTPSAARFKRDLEPWTENVDAFLDLVPRKGRFVWDADDAPKRAFLIAEELIAAGFEEMVPLVDDPEHEDYGKPLTINYAELTIPLLMAARAQRAEALAQREQLTRQQLLIDALSRRLLALEKKDKGNG